MAALASLTEMYTDSEGEEQVHRSGQRDSDSDEIPEKLSSSMNISFSRNPPREDLSKPTRTSSTLVSYLNDTVLSDDDGDRDYSSKPEPMDLTSEEPESPPTPVMTEKVSKAVVELPAEPAGKCSNEMQQKIASLTEKMKLKGHDMNQIIQERKSFRNPSIYEKLIQFCGINEFGTNYAPQIYDPDKWNKSSYYDELAMVQKIEMDKREKDRKEKTKVEFIMGTAKKPANGSAVASAAEDERKRKSKWDQVGLVGAGGAVRATGTASLITLTSTSTGTKSTVISAFGSLPKKPKT